MPKKPIWLDDHEAEVMLGYVAELLDDKSDTPDNDREVLSAVYDQLTEKPEVPKCDFCLEVDIFQPMVQRANHVICQTCADDAQAEVDAENRAHDQL
jgi:hypothetical protein